jgi:lipoprotein-anchoring transpeptidase ErfK/SrfK
MDFALQATHIQASLSRRDFLKITAFGALNLVIGKMIDLSSQALEDQCRVIDASIKMYNMPSFNGDVINTYWQDMVLPITEATIGDQEPAHNRVWYLIGNEGYIHSGSVQPVKTQLNPIVRDLPPNGSLAEVTVPFTDAHWGSALNFPVAYRFYYETTHWVTGLSFDKEGQPWYRIRDDKWDIRYYAPASHLRLVSSDELSPISPDVSPSAKRIEVQTPDQAVIAYEWDRPVFVTRTATGAKFSNGNFATPKGRYITNHKRPSRHMAAGNLAYNGYDLPGVPWVTYITESGISFHGTYWHNNYGRPRSHGCINLTPKAAKWLYRWTLPVVPPKEPSIYEKYGTPVDVV